MKFVQITPANRATLSIKHGCSPTSQLVSSSGQLSQGSQVVDLTDNATMHGLKKAKIADNVSSQPQHNVESRALPGYQGEQPTPPPERSTLKQSCEKNEAIQEGSGGHGSITGPAFLKLVCCLCVLSLI